MRVSIISLSLATALLGLTGATTDHNPRGGAVRAASAELSSGEVRRIDKAGGRITLKHGEIKNLGMPPMTMVFRVKDKAVLDRFKPGDKVRFVVEDIGGATTVTRIELAT